jgi:hypothetical protein
MSDVKQVFGIHIGRVSRIGQFREIRWSAPGKPVTIGPVEYGVEQLSAGFRAMNMLAGFVRRGGHPAGVAPTIPLRPSEKQYGWFPVTVDGTDRRIAVITNLRLIVGEEYPLWLITRVRPIPGEWSVKLDLRGGPPLELSGPWVPWMSVVICAELYGTAWPPSAGPAAVPAPRHRQVATCLGRR